MTQQVIRPKHDTGAKSFRVLDALTPLNGTAAPAVNADYLGQHFIDETAKNAYISVAVDSVDPTDDWKLITATAI